MSARASPAEVIGTLTARAPEGCERKDFSIFMDETLPRGKFPIARMKPSDDCTIGIIQTCAVALFKRGAFYSSD